jgi:hypothetical protein
VTRIPLDVVARPWTALPELPPLPIGALVVGAAELLQQAASLPAPVYVTVHDTQTISVQFARHRASKRAVTQWARRFGSVVASYPDQDQPGTWTWCRTDFDYYGIAVTAYALIPAAPGQQLADQENP